MIVILLYNVDCSYTEFCVYVYVCGYVCVCEYVCCKTWIAKKVEEFFLLESGRWVCSKIVNLYRIVENIDVPEAVKGWVFDKN